MADDSFTNQALVERLTIGFEHFVTEFIRPGKTRLLGYENKAFEGSRGISGLPNKVYDEPIREIIRNNQFNAVEYRDGKWVPGAPLTFWNTDGTSKIEFGTPSLLGNEDLAIFQDALNDLHGSLQEEFRRPRTLIVFMEGLNKKVRDEALKLGEAEPNDDVNYGSHYGLERPYYYIDLEQLRGPRKDLVMHLQHEGGEPAVVINNLSEANLLNAQGAVRPRQERDSLFNETLNKIERQAHFKASKKGVAAAAKNQARRTTPPPPEKRFKLRNVSRLLSLVLNTDATVADRTKAVMELAVHVALEGRTWQDALGTLRVLRIMADFWKLRLLSDTITSYVTRVENIVDSRSQKNLDFKMPGNQSLRPVDVLTILRKQLDLFRRDFGFIRLAEEIPPRLPKGYVADEARFAQLISVFLGNARDTVEKKISISIQLRVTAELTAKGKRIKVVIQDFGMGITPEILPLIFTQYYSTKNENAGQRGEGLRDFTLLPARGEPRPGHIVVLHNPTGLLIHVDSEKEKGTTLKIYINVAPDATDPRGAGPTAGVQQPGQASPSQKEAPKRGPRLSSHLAVSA